MTEMKVTEIKLDSIINIFITFLTRQWKDNTTYIRYITAEEKVFPKAPSFVEDHAHYFYKHLLNAIKVDYSYARDIQRTYKGYFPSFWAFERVLSILSSSLNIHIIVENNGKFYSDHGSNTSKCTHKLTIKTRNEKQLVGSDFVESKQLGKEKSKYEESKSGIKRKSTFSESNKKRVDQTIGKPVHASDKPKTSQKGRSKM